MASAYVVHSFPAPIVVVDQNENAAYVVNTTVVVAGSAPPVVGLTSSRGFFMMLPSIVWTALYLGALSSLL
jgi:hypothetical protein